MLSQPLKEYLDSHQIQYSTITHPASYTAPQTAQAAHISGQHIAKVVVVKLDDRFAMVAIPANKGLDFEEILAASGASKIELAHEYEFSELFRECEVGAMPPIGDLYGIDLYAASSLVDQNWIAFNGGDHKELVKVSCKDYLKWAHPKLLANC